MNNVLSQKQLNWQCRRGMLELDVILIPFLKEHYEDLTDALKLNFSTLLKQEDPDLYTWIMGFGKCNIADFLEIIKIIRSKMLIA